MGAKFLDLLQQSVVIQGSVTLLWFLVTGWLLVHQTPIDDKWWGFGIALIAFWFGGKSVMMFQHSLRKVQKDD